MFCAVLLWCHSSFWAKDRLPRSTKASRARGVSHCCVSRDLVTHGCQNSRRTCSAEKPVRILRTKPEFVVSAIFLPSLPVSSSRQARTTNWSRTQSVSYRKQATSTSQLEREPARRGQPCNLFAKLTLTKHIPLRTQLPVMDWNENKNQSFRGRQKPMLLKSPTNDLLLFRIAQSSSLEWGSQTERSHAIVSTNLRQRYEKVGKSISDVCYFIAMWRAIKSKKHVRKVVAI